MATPTWSTTNIGDIASEGPEGLDELVVPIGRVISYPPTSPLNRPAV